MSANLVPRSPLRELASLQHDMDRVLSGFGLFPRAVEPITESDLTVPSIDILTRGDDMIMRADIPGVTPDGIEISVTDGTLTLTATRRETTETADEDYVIRERKFGSYERTMTLPEGVEPDTIHAEFVDGVLEIVLPGAAHPTHRESIRIPVETPAVTARSVHH